MIEICKINNVGEYYGEPNAELVLCKLKISVDNDRFIITSKHNSSYYGITQIDLLDILNWVNEHQQYLHDIGLYDKKEI